MFSKINFSLTQLEYVLAVKRLGHFAKAAEACHVTQPTLSMQIQKLEENLGVVIFDRSKKPILLTEIGAKLIEAMQEVIEDAKKIESLISSQRTDIVSGELTIGIIPTIAPYLLPYLLPAVAKKFPALSLKIQELQTLRIIEALDTDAIEAGILALPLKIPKIIETPLYYEPFSIVCKNDHPISKMKSIKYNALHFEDIWLLEEGHCLRHQVLDVCTLKQKTSGKRQFQFESGSLETLKNIIDSFGGYTLLPKLAASKIGKHSILVPFEQPVPSRQVGLVHRREHHKSQLLQALIGCILESLPSEIKNIRPKTLDVLDID